MNRNNLATKYRPERFEHVWGQEHAKRFLSGLIIHGQRGRNLLLHGTVGSGKTSLVRLYAKALNCLAPTDSGSPCGRCRWCAEPDRRQAGFHEYDVSGRGGDKQAIRAWLDELNRSPGENRFRVLFFDEAHSLTSEAADSLLKSVEDPKEGVIFCFATTEIARVRPALLSRLSQLEVRPLPADLAIRFLQDAADREGIPYDTEALALLAGLKNGYPRDLLTGLEQVYDPALGAVTLERVRAVFDVDHTEVLVAYFLALADGDFARQTEVIFAWRETAADKARWTQAFLISLYYNDVHHIPFVGDPLIHSIKAERGPILDRFCQRLGLTTRGDLAPFWRSMMAFWRSPLAESDETAVSLQFTLFHELVNEGLTRSSERKAPQRRGGAAAGFDRSGTAVPPQADGSPDARERVPHDCKPGSGFLRAEDARELINRASFFVQEYGAPFNVSFEIRPFLFGIDSEPEGRQLILEFCGELENLVRGFHAGNGAPFAHLTLFEIDPDGIRGFVVAHLPRTVRNGRIVGIDGVSKAAEWQRHWRSSLRIGRHRKALRFEPGPAADREALKFHWDRVLNLCAGLSEDEEDWDPLRQTTAPLLELLKIPGSQRRSPGPVKGPLFIASASLQRRAIDAASANRMEPLSAVDARAWDWIRKGWEADEHPDRYATKRERAAELNELRQIHGDGTPEGRAALDQRVQTWPTHPEHRKRRWPGWWKRAEA